MHQQILYKAVTGRNTIKIKYDDDTLEREFSPYIVFYSSKGNESVSGYQIDNPAEPMEKNQWRQLTTSKLKTVRTTENTFAVDPRFNPADKVYGNRVICHVKQNV